MSDREAIITGIQFIVEAVIAVLLTFGAIILFPVWWPIAIGCEWNARRLCAKHGHVAVDDYFQAQADVRNVWCRRCDAQFTTQAPARPDKE